MTAPALFSGQSFVALGWALFQFLWQGALVAGLFAALQRLLRNRTPALRYALACGALATMIGLPIATAWSLSARGGRHSSPASPTSTPSAEALPLPASCGRDADVGPMISATLRNRRLRASGQGA
jgi:hypothetical protein